MTFICIGQGPEESQIRRLARDLKLDTNLRILGFRSDARRFMAAADLFVLASTHEGLPVAVMEALSLGVPIVATRQAAYRNSSAAMPSPGCCAIGDSDKLSRSMPELLLDRGRRQKMSDEALRASTAFDIRRAAEVSEAQAYAKDDEYRDNPP